MPMPVWLMILIAHLFALTKDCFLEIERRQSAEVTYPTEDRTGSKPHLSWRWPDGSRRSRSAVSVWQFSVWQLERLANDDWNCRKTIHTSIGLLPNSAILKK